MQNINKAPAPVGTSSLFLVSEVERVNAVLTGAGQISYHDKVPQVVNSLCFLKVVATEADEVLKLDKVHCKMMRKEMFVAVFGC